MGCHCVNKFNWTVVDLISNFFRWLAVCVELIEWIATNNMKDVDVDDIYKWDIDTHIFRVDLIWFARNYDTRIVTISDFVQMYLIWTLIQTWLRLPWREYHRLDVLISVSSMSSPNLDVDHKKVVGRLYQRRKRHIRCVSESERERERDRIDKQRKFDVSILIR